jgi:hypothetical protein
MTRLELDKLEEIRQEALTKLRDKYGDTKVQQVDDLGADITIRMIGGEKIAGIESWMYDLLNDFQELITSHPAIVIPVH